MLFASRKILQFVADATEDQFLANTMLQSAVLHQMTVLGEAAKRVAPDFRTAHPGIDWPAMAGLRNRIVHDYDHISIDKVWNIVRAEVPELLRTLEQIVPAEPDGEEDR
ncbi:MAG: DUF86 domain-containing protein [Acidobacteriota bacterium]|nr:DUF86 domain-containing protein [Acidobacteriota bacterium]